MSRFLEKLETEFLNELSEQLIPKHVAWTDGQAVRMWVEEAFGYWLLVHRDDRLAREWVRHGWAVEVQHSRADSIEVGYQVRPECRESIRAWLEDEID